MLARARDRAAAALLYRGAPGRLAGRFRVVGGLRWHERTSGPGAERSPVVLVHGLGVSSRYFAPLAVRLAAHVPVVAPDLPGFGRSDSPPRALSVRELAEALADWLDAAGVRQAPFVGNSFGCQVLIELAARTPERVSRLVLIGPAVDGGARTAYRQIVRLAVDTMREPPGLIALAAFDYLVAGPARCLATFRHSLRDRPEAKLASVLHPVLVVRGMRDALVSEAWAEAVAAGLPNGRLVTVPGAPHAAHYSHPDAVADRVLAFVLAGP